MAIKKLSVGFVKTASAEPGAERSIYWDETLPSFGLMVTSGGHRSYVAQYRARGASRRFTIGSASKLDLDQARRKAKTILGQVADGSDPVIDKRKAAEGDTRSGQSANPISAGRVASCAPPIYGARPLSDLSTESSAHGRSTR
jgi:hypothetical protein